MTFKFSKNFDEMCYPFMYESSSLCDFEIITDELCGHIGAVISYLPDNMPDLAADLEQIQPLAFHINGSIRGRLAVSEEDQAWLQARLNYYKEEVAERLGGFVLPRGTSPIPQLHLARSACKKAIRVMVKVNQEGKEVPMLLPRMCNMLCNFFFMLTLVINKRRGVKEPEFVSRSYGKQPEHHTKP